MRPLFALLAQTLVALGLKRRGHPAPWRAAGGWWSVDGSLVDLGCLAALRWLTRREGIRLRDLLGTRRGVVPDALRRIPMVLAALVPAVAGSALLQRAFYGDEMPPQIALARLPRRAAAYSIAIWPAMWGLMEELTYLGYALPRLEVQTRRPGLSASLVAAAWAGQHLAMPFVPDRRYLVSRALTALPVACATTGFFMRSRRLQPLIAVHWVADIGTAVTAATATAPDKSPNPNGVAEAARAGARDRTVAPRDVLVNRT